MNFEVATQPGERVARFVDVEIGREKIPLPLFVIHGKNGGPTLGITAGVHGTEYASIEAALRLGRTLDPEEVRGKVVILPVANLPSFRKRSIYVGPVDGKNLNRMFPGKADGTFSEILAGRIFQELIREADYYIDLHGGDMNEALTPFVIYAPTGSPEVDRASLAMAESFGIELVVTSQTPGMSMYAASHAGVPAILAEAGGQGLWTEETVAIHFEGVRNVMMHLRMLEGKPKRHPARVFPFPWLYSEHDGVFYPHAAIGEKISKGQKVGSVCDYFGNELQAALSPTDGTILFLVTSLAINKGDPLMGIGG